MCGLIAFTKPKLFTKKDMQRGLDSIKHRGTLKPRIMTTSRCMFGHVRLPIQSLGDDGEQPVLLFRDEAGVFVGEVFNLDSRKVDSVQALNLVRRLGPRAASNFDGFFSMVYQYGNSIIAQVDHLGIKPLYFHEDSGMIASEIKAFPAVMPMGLKADEHYMATVTNFGYDITDRTPLEGVRRLKAGTYLEITEHGVEEIHYFPLVPDPEIDLFTALSKSVERRINMSKQPVGVLLSGGLDSTIITMLAQQHRPEGIIAFHVDNDEGEYARMVSMRPQDKLIALVLDDSNLPRIMYANDTPVDLGSVVPQFALAQAVKEHNIHVVLTGDGADELFGGYRRAAEYDSQRSDVFSELPAYHLPRLDAVMMSQTIEVRAPFLAPEVVRKALSLPWEERRHKEYLKEKFKNYVPKEILDRKKKALKTTTVEKGGFVHRTRLIQTYREAMSRVATTYQKEIHHV